MKIKGTVHITQNDNEIFWNDVNTWINRMQDNGQEVEIQYKPVMTECQGIVFTALLIGRVKE